MKSRGEAHIPEPLTEREGGLGIFTEGDPFVGRREGG